MKKPSEKKIKNEAARQLGSKGGEATKKNQPPDYYKKIAKKRWQTKDVEKSVE
jgi:hypothetical protein